MRAVPPHLQVVLPVYHQSVAKHVPHDDQVGLLTVHAHPVHAQELWQQGAAVTLDYVLQRGNNCEFAWQVERVDSLAWAASVLNIQMVKQSKRVTDR